jgi:hypothetical protein
MTSCFGSCSCDAFAENAEGRMSLAQETADSDPANSLTLNLRRKRFRRFLELVDRCPQRPLQILDVGGTEQFWETMGYADCGHKITLLNLTAAPTRHENIVSVAGDAAAMPQFGDDRFDIVFSNSVIEHLRSLDRQRRMAGEVRRLAKRYFVQTPNYWFPIEPHFWFPGFQFLPVAARVWLLRHRALGSYPRAANERQAREFVDEIRLLKKAEVKALFPDATILHERFLGMTKSFMAVRR